MDKKAFIAEFIKNNEADYEDRKELVAAAYSEWRKKNGKRNVKGNLSTIKANFQGLSRRDAFSGREYVVAPCIMIKEGVHSGSAGPLYYPESELSSTVMSWNHKPVTLGHPTVNGKPVSACSKDILEKYQLGILMNSSFGEDINGTRAEAWLDVEKTNALAPGLIANIESDRVVMEVSTGLFTDDIDESGEWGGEKFNAIAFNHCPDHLAILVDEKGACSVEDGAGIPRINKSVDKSVDLRTNKERSFDEIRRLLNTALEAESDKWTYILDVYDTYFIYENENLLYRADYAILDGSAQLGESVGVERVVTYVIKKGAIHMNRKERISELVANTNWTEQDSEFLEKLEDGEFEKVVANSVKPEPVKQEKAPDLPVAKPVEQPTENKMMTFDEFVNSAPTSEYRDTLLYAVNKMRTEKAEVKGKILANKRNEFSAEELESMDLNSLQRVERMIADVSADYSGQGHQPMPTANFASVEPLPEPPSL